MIGGRAQTVGGPEIGANRIVTFGQEFYDEAGNFQSHNSGAWYVLYLEFETEGQEFDGTYFVPIQDG